MQNDNLVLISGKSATGKSASLANIKDPKGVLYLNCEAGKKLPFKSSFTEFTVLDPLKVYEAFDQAEKQKECHTIIIDTLTYLMDLYESKYVLPAADGRSAWQSYAQYFRNLMQTYVAKSTKNVIILAHSTNQLNEAEMVTETFVPIKGATAKVGVESFFSTVISTKKMSLLDLEKYGSPLLNVSEEEEMLGYKYVYQTKLTKDSINERIRGPMGMWSNGETFIDNSAQHVIDKLKDYYA